ncbi:hypothetical protein IQ260_26360 [Leptolyngbya cf. ectocarpi LEGE 11479]|uniref:Uncharacterized protein n=1 Tax=Leptolyngbya cf. ectocarpi LEGE 11479 TaxID=1828722 RepID=A0A928ZZ46_LEPEC|nr:hypothetical protein [Leptolyngbya ectocarpi]MBE9070169.1 hypothetical protein [Leptolyngbya cf. ectocarpi LEGE 11479]
MTKHSLDETPEPGLQLPNAALAAVLLEPNTWHRRQVSSPPVDGYPRISKQSMGLGYCALPPAICHDLFVGG